MRRAPRKSLSHENIEPLLSFAPRGLVLTCQPNSSGHPSRAPSAARERERSDLARGGARARLKQVSTRVRKHPTQSTPYRNHVPIGTGVRDPPLGTQSMPATRRAAKQRWGAPRAPHRSPQARAKGGMGYSPGCAIGARDKAPLQNDRRPTGGLGYSPWCVNRCPKSTPILSNQRGSERSPHSAPSASEGRGAPASPGGCGGAAGADECRSGPRRGQ